MMIYECVKQQSRSKSMLESVIDIAIGFIIYLPINYFTLPLFSSGIENQEILTMLQISALYTCFALTRRYAIRRWFVGFR